MPLSTLIRVSGAVPPVAVPEFVVEEPLRDPVGRIAGISETPECGSPRVPAAGEQFHGVPLALLCDIVPVEGRREPAVGLEVVGTVGDPGVDTVGFILCGDKSLACLLLYVKAHVCHVGKPGSIEWE